MDEFYCKTVTVFNRVKASSSLDNDTWLPSVMHNVRLLINKGANVSTSGITDADSAKLFLKDEYMDKPYMLPKEWQRSTSKANYFTLTGQTDFFVSGDVSAESPSGDFYSYMKKKYDNCFMITNADRYELIPHWEVGGK